MYRQSDIRKRIQISPSRTSNKIPSPYRLDALRATVDEATNFLINSGKSPKILIKIARNMGDSMHGQPIIRHYRNLYPNAAIVFMTEEKYRNVHEYDTNIDKIITLPNGLDNKERLALWPLIKNNKHIDISIVPAINPFQALYKENAWCHNNIADQYFYNAGIKDLNPLGGRHIEVKYDDNDRKIANNLITEDRSKLIALEYISYSTPPIWKTNTYTAFVQQASRLGFKCVSIASKNEPLIPGTIDCRGITWRQTVAVLSKIGYLIGCGSGITVLGAASRPQPRIIELDIPDNVTIAGCQYADGILLKRPTPDMVINKILGR